MVHPSVPFRLFVCTHKSRRRRNRVAEGWRGANLEQESRSSKIDEDTATGRNHRPDKEEY